MLIPQALGGTVESFEDLNDAGYRIRVKAGTTGEIVAKKLIGNAQLVSYATEEEGCAMCSTARPMPSFTTRPTIWWR